MSKFKLGILAVFSAFILIGIIVFASSKSQSEKFSGNLTIWGTVNSNTINQFLSSFSFDSKKNVTANYIQKKPEDFGISLAEAIADGKSPDLVILPIDLILNQQKRLLTIPFKSYPERTFKNTYIEESELFLTKEGILAIPILIDPLVMYWNRDIFSAKLKTNPPLYWDEFQKLAPEFVKKDTSGNIKDTLISFGEWKNVSNAKEILTNLLIQTGNSIITKDDYGFRSSILNSSDNPSAGAESALTFYTQFANPVDVTYSWNRSLPKSINMFLSENLATYIGQASELPQIRSKNPNLNFDVALIPQIRDAKQKRVFSKMYGIAIVKNSKLIPVAFQAMNTMTDAERLKIMETITNLPPVRRDLLSNIPTTDSYKEIFYKSAIWSKGFYDVDSKAIDTIFGRMIESITSGRSKISEALSDASDNINYLIENNAK